MAIWTKLSSGVLRLLLRAQNYLRSVVRPQYEDPVEETR